MKTQNQIIKNAVKKITGFSSISVTKGTGSLKNFILVQTKENMHEYKKQLENIFETNLSNGFLMAIPSKSNELVLY